VEQDANGYFVNYSAPPEQQSTFTKEIAFARRRLVDVRRHQVEEQLLPKSSWRPSECLKHITLWGNLPIGGLYNGGSWFLTNDVDPSRARGMVVEP